MLSEMSTPRSVGLLARAVAASAVLTLATPAHATPVPVSVTITSVECTQEDECRNAGLEAAGESWPDFYAKIFINGVETVTGRAPDEQQVGPRRSAGPRGRRSRTRSPQTCRSASRSGTRTRPAATTSPTVRPGPTTTTPTWS